MYTTLIAAAQLKTLLASKHPVMVFDCTFELAQPQFQRQFPPYISS